MQSAIKAAADFVAMLPKDNWCPESTEGMEGFVHPTSISGLLEKATVQLIVRDFDTKKLSLYAQRLTEMANTIMAQYPGLTADVQIKEQYRNMKEVLDLHPHVMAFAEEAYLRAGLQPHRMSIRGGTDGSRLSFMGLPCPNIFTGEMSIHSKQEYVSVQDMEKATEICVHLAQIYAEKA
jgi:tripeptide aminopeptidase